MKTILKVIFPKWCINCGKILIAAIHLLPDYNYWFWRDIRESSLICNKESDLVGLMITSHVLEKGLTMPKRRLGFGYDRVRAIIKRCNKCIHLYSEKHMEIQSALKDLEQYLQLHEKEGFNLPSDILVGAKTLLQYKCEETKDCFESAPEDLFIDAKDFCEFAYSRHSCRWYSDEEINHNVLIEAIMLAQTAPSACNRQSTRVYVIESKEKKQQVLHLQNGNRGFGHLANKIILITSDMKCWNYNNRTSAYLDAGIFTMNLLYSLHYYKICACTLNAHLTINQRTRLQKIVGYPESEMPIVFISIGKAPAHFQIAGSQRLKVESIYKFV